MKRNKLHYLSNTLVTYSGLSLSLQPENMKAAQKKKKIKSALDAKQTPTAVENCTRS